MLRGAESVTAPLEAGMQGVVEKIPAEYPGLRTAAYTGLQMLDPEHLLPTSATIAALRGAQNVARTPGQFAPIQRKAWLGSFNQAGAWVPGDIADVEGDFSLRSPTVEAFNKLKKQEQGNLKGKQLMKALTREGAKKEELQWLGLDKVLDTDEMLSVADVRKLAEANQPQITHTQARAGGEGGELDDEAVSEAAYQRAYEDEDLEYPLVARQSIGRGRYETLETFDSQREADRWLERYKEDYIDNEKERFLSEYQDILDADDLETFEALDEDGKDRYAQRYAESGADDYINDAGIEIEQDRDAEPSNLDDLRNYWEDEIRRDPESYGLSKGQEGAPAWGDYTGRGERLGAGGPVYGRHDAARRRVALRQEYAVAGVP